MVPAVPQLNVTACALLCLGWGKAGLQSQRFRSNGGAVSRNGCVVPEQILELLWVVSKWGECCSVCWGLSPWPGDVAGPPARL